MNYLQFKALATQLAVLNPPDSAVIKVKHLDTSRIDLQGENFIVEGKDATWSIDATGHWAGVASEIDAVILKQE